MSPSELSDLVRDFMWKILAVNGMECPCCERGAMSHAEAQEHIKTCEELQELAKEHKIAEL